MWKGYVMPSVSSPRVSLEWGRAEPGQVTKLCNQVIAASNLVTIAEAISLAERSGVDASALPEALAGGFADSIPLQIFGPRFAKRQYEPFLGHVYTMMKDLDTARDLGQEKGRRYRCHLSPLKYCVKSPAKGTRRRILPT